MTKEEFDALPPLTAEDCVEGTVYAGAADLLPVQMTAELAQTMARYQVNWSHLGHFHLVSRPARVGDLLTRQNARVGMRVSSILGSEFVLIELDPPRFRGSTGEHGNLSWATLAKDLRIIALPESAEPAVEQGNATMPLGMEAECDGCEALIDEGERFWSRGEGDDEVCRCIPCGPCEPEPVMPAGKMAEVGREPDVLTLENARPGLVVAMSAPGTRGTLYTLRRETGRGSWQVDYAMADGSRQSSWIEVGNGGWHIVDEEPCPEIARGPITGMEWVTWDGIPSAPERRQLGCRHGYLECTICDYDRRYNARETNAACKTEEDFVGERKRRLAEPWSNYATPAWLAGIVDGSRCMLCHHLGPLCALHGSQKGKDDAAR